MHACRCVYVCLYTHTENANRSAPLLCVFTFCVGICMCPFMHTSYTWHTNIHMYTHAVVHTLKDNVCVGTGNYKFWPFLYAFFFLISCWNLPKTPIFFLFLYTCVHVSVYEFLAKISFCNCFTGTGRAWPCR